eukprot:397046-Rhodomonas_salina.1
MQCAVLSSRTVRSGGGTGTCPADAGTALSHPMLLPYCPTPCPVLPCPILLRQPRRALYGKQ